MSKRPTDEDEGPKKRARVSRACIGCRKRKERCDGIQPVCGPCRSQDRQCCYAPGQKKRGLPTGYVRALEILLGLVFHSVQDSEPSALALLRGETPVPGADIDNPSASTINFLADTWRESTVWKELEKILVSAEPKDADGVSARVLHDRLEHVMRNALNWDMGQDSSVETARSSVYVEASESSPATAVSQVPVPSCPAVLQDPPFEALSPARPQPGQHLPSNWPGLVEIYYTNTHCWFPIVPKQDILRPVHALGISSSMPTASPPKPGELAALWALLAYASHQNLRLSSVSPSELEARVSNDYLEHAVFLATNTSGQFESGHVQALLILALLRLGQRNASQAWLLVGRAVYMAIDLGIVCGKRPAGSSPLDDRTERLCFGCFVLDTLVSCRLERRPYLRVTDLPSMGLTHIDGIEEWEFWNPTESNHGPIPAKSLSTFNSCIEVVTLMNNLAHSPPDTLSLHDLTNITQGFMSSSAAPNLHQLSLSRPNSSMTPQSINLILLFASLCAILRRTAASISEVGRTLDPWASLSSLSSITTDHLRENARVSIPPLCDVYLRILATSPKPQHGTGQASANEDATYVAMIATLQEQFNRLWAKSYTSDGGFQAQAPRQDPLSNLLTGLEAYEDVTSHMETGCRMNIDDNGLYDSMLSLDMGDW
jgi:hypothetical protein